jgi:hypothetical protein
MLSAINGGAPAGVDEPNIAANGGKVEMSTFNHPWSELDDLFRREKFLSNEFADDHVADVKRFCGLMHRKPHITRVWPPQGRLDGASLSEHLRHLEEPRLRRHFLMGKKEDPDIHRLWTRPQDTRPRTAAGAVGSYNPGPP